MILFNIPSTAFKTKRCCCSRLWLPLAIINNCCEDSTAYSLCTHERESFLRRKGVQHNTSLILANEIIKELIPRLKIVKDNATITLDDEETIKATKVYETIRKTQLGEYRQKFETHIIDEEERKDLYYVLHVLKVATYTFRFRYSR